MEKYIILIAGPVGAGKTTFSEKISKELNIPFFNKDSIKEILFDELGAADRKENKKLSEVTFSLLLHIAERFMRCNMPLILESNFRDGEADGLEKIISKHGYTPITILLTCDLKVLHRRFIDRFYRGDRHKAHLTFDLDINNYGNFLKIINSQLNFKIFGERIFIDTTKRDTDKEKQKVIADIKAIMGRRER